MHSSTNVAILQSLWSLQSTMRWDGKSGEGDIDFLTPARALHFYFALEPTDYVAGHEWK